MDGARCLLAASRLWHHGPVSADTPLQRDAPYVQIIEHYRQQIRDGRLQDGDMLPSGREIAAQFGVSLATAAKVATGLQALGLVTPRPGAGTVVTAPRPPADRARGGPLLIILATRTPSRPGDKARVLDTGIVAAPQDIAGQLGIELPAQVVRRRQASIRDGVTAAMLTSWFPQLLAEGVPELLSRTRLTDEIPGYQPSWGEDWISARPPTSAEARQFEIKRGSPVAVVHSRRFDADDTVIEYSELIARADTRIVYRYTYGGLPPANRPPEMTRG
jgi:DNA-binding GntR family transcriptional regulator